ncbi:MAG: restriction endonuclease [Candidatus Aenigmatarchaeota archaeon]
MRNIPKYITKADGSKERFDRSKILRACEHIGLDMKQSNEVADYVDRALPEGSSTHKLHVLLMEQLDKRNIESAPLLALRDAIADIDSKNFEIFTKRMLEADGYKCKWNQIMRGASVDHQIDVLAEKDDQIFIVECKRHFNPHRFCGLDVSLQEKARLDDITDGYTNGKNKVHVTAAWIFTNAKFSEHAKAYCKAKGIRMTGWKTGEFGIEIFVKKNNIYPVTILKADLNTKVQLIQAGLLTLQDVINKKRSNISNFPDIVQQAKRLLKK